jgi:beta-lactam-binding protein with PASTA domain
MVVSMPAVEGESLDKAELIVSKAGLRTGRVSRVHSDTVGKDMVIAQRPQIGEPGGGMVSLLVSLGPYEVSYKCPSFTDRSLEDARALTQRLGLRLSEKGKGDKILSQKPNAGSVIKKGATVEVTIGEETKEW